MASVAGLELGDMVADKYVLRERLGEGGMGLVFLADQPALARSVAIKVLHPSLQTNAFLARRFRDEAAAACRVRHPGAVSVIDYDCVAGMPFIVMERVEGRPLGQIVAEQEMPLRRALAIVDRILDVVGAVHTAGVVHGDIKSDNFLVDEGPDGDVVTLIDFGLARLASAVPDSGLVSGTPEYMAPELVRGQPATRSSDLYGVAVILYELLTGKAPFAGDTATEILKRQLHDVVIPPALRQPDRDIPAALDAIVVRALAKDAAARFATAEELRRALQTVVVRNDAPRFVPRPRPLDAHRAEARTRARTAPRVRFARGSDSDALVRGGRRDGGELRHVIANALIDGDVAAIRDGYLAYAESLVREHRLGEAVRELEEGLDILAAGDCPRDPIVLALAALHERVGDRCKADSLLAITDHRDTEPNIVSPP